MARGVEELLELADAYVAFDPSRLTTRTSALLYPGTRAVAVHRLAHALHRRQQRFLPWVLMELSRLSTGIEIGPGARLGRRVLIIHGTGTVIGNTAVVEDGVVMLHGVTLGSRNIRNPPPGKRHPTIRTNATLCAGACILGNVTVGEGATVGANAVVLEDVPAHHVAVGAPARLRPSRSGTPQPGLRPAAGGTQ